MLDLSVIIVSWNVREHLQRCLTTLPEAITDAYRWEVIVVDNASTDGSADCVRRQFENARVIANPVNRLYTLAANQGLDVASGRHCLILNPDTLPQPESLARLIEYAESNDQAGLVGPRIVDADGHDDMLTGRYFPTLRSVFADWLGLTRRFPDSHWISANLRPSYNRRQTSPVPLLSGACLLLPERLPTPLRRFDPHFIMYGEDVDLCRRIQVSGLQAVFVGDAVICHVGGASSRQQKLRSTILAADGDNRYFQKWCGAGAARRHRLTMALVAIVKTAAFTLLGLSDRRPDAYRQRSIYLALLRWAVYGNIDDVLRTEPSVSSAT